jgi:hypothetical protein
LNIFTIGGILGYVGESLSCFINTVRGVVCLRKVMLILIGVLMALSIAGSAVAAQPDGCSCATHCYVCVI